MLNVKNILIAAVVAAIVSYLSQKTVRKMLEHA